VEGDTIQIPADVRRRFLLDPARAPEWRLTLGKFDTLYGVEQSAQDTSVEQVPSPIVNFVWGSQFAADNEPMTVEALSKRYSGGPDKAAEFEATKPSQYGFVLVEGPKLFVCVPRRTSC